MTETPDRPRVIVAGQVPPPLSGQHIAVGRLLQALCADGRFRTEHLPYGFAPTMQDQGALAPGKAVELVRIASRMLRLRARGPIDVLVHPIGGTTTGSTLRDILVVLLAEHTCRRTVLQFHGAGHRRWASDRSPLIRLAHRVLGRADAAIVHTEANRVDAEVLGIERIYVAPHQIEDTFDPTRVHRHDEEIHVLYLGHLGPHRGTPELVNAVSRIIEDEPRLRLTLAGSPTGQYSTAELHAQLVRNGVESVVSVVGEVRGATKDDLFGRAHLFAFPTVFRAESFGLVLAEALMWGLPIVATDWRGNAEVLAGTDSIIHPYGPDLSAAIEQGLRDAIGRLAAGLWDRSFSKRNREVFEARYGMTMAPSPAVTAIACVAGIEGSTSAADPGTGR